MLLIKIMILYLRNARCCMIKKYSVKCCAKNMIMLMKIKFKYIRTKLDACLHKINKRGRKTDYITI